MFADLHLHTRFSDGTFSPEELAAAAKKSGLSAIALTDHDTMEGCASTALACAERSIQFLPGCELTAEHEGHELHVLGYGLDETHAGLAHAMGGFQQARQDRIREIVSRLQAAGVSIQEEAVFRLANCNSPGRPHVGRALVEAGVCKSMDEAFDRFLKKSKPGWVPKFRMSAQEVIQLIHLAGGAAVLAHPALYRLDSALPALVQAGLDGLECLHTKHSAGAVEHYTGLALEHGLLITGGSDCHGFTKGSPIIGRIQLPWERYGLVVARVQERRQAVFRAV